MDEELQNCAVRACCPSLERATEAFATILVNEGACRNRKDAIEVAKCTYKYFDLAPTGTLVPLVTAIAKLVRG